MYLLRNATQDLHHDPKLCIAIDVRHLLCLKCANDVLDCCRILANHIDDESAQLENIHSKENY